MALWTKRRRRAAAKRRTAAKRRRSPLGRLVNWGGTALIWLALGFAAVVVWYGYDIPDIARLEAKLEREPRITLVAYDGREIASFGGRYGRPVPLAELPRHLVDAVIATEDRRFRRHFGIDLVGLGRAAYANLRAGRIVQGGSTITQQLAKNVWLTPERTIRRKAQELLLALWLERRFTKDRILELYLNRVYLGAGTYGVEAAARRYFAKSARRLTLAESAMLAGLLKAPSYYAPTVDLKRAQDRAAQVLENMTRAGVVDPAAAAAARRNPARLATGRRKATSARYFADWAVERVASFVGPAAGDLVVVTTLDLDLQLAAERAVEEVLAREGKRAGAGQAALLALSPEGAVRAMVGGRSYAASQYNRATAARRQPGSAFKLFVYLAGLEAGFRPDDRWRDRPIDIDGWRPRNYSGRYVGEVTLREAFARSINSVAVQVAEKVGRRKVIEAARRLGISGRLAPHPSLALGASEVSLLELSAAYATVANGGKGIIPHGILEIRDAAGRVLYLRRGGGPGRVIGRREAARLNDMLIETVRTGTGKAARLDRPAAGKTGTSQDYRDAWFIGYTPNLVAGVWTGNDDAAPMNKVTGGGLPARIWRRFMVAALAGTPKIAFAPAPPESRTLWDKIVATFGSGLRSSSRGPSAPERKEFP